MSHRNPASLTEAQRNEIRRAMLPAGAIRAAHKRGLWTVFLYTNPRGMICAAAFAGKAIKPAFRAGFTTEALRVQHCADFARRMERAEEEKRARRAARNSGHQLKAGDVLSSVWGYDQTNVDYYEVTRLIGKTMVEVRKIACESKADAWMQGEMVPVPGSYIGEPKRRKADGKQHVETRTDELQLPETRMRGEQLDQ